MPLNGGGTASKPPGTTAVPNSTIASAPFNSVIDDIYAIFNTPRPIAYGGTNGSSAVEGIDNLSTKGTDIASATTTDIGAATGRFVHITGTTTITSLGTKAAGVVRFVVFDGALTLTHNATSLILPGAANIVTAAGDTAIFISEGSGNWRCVEYVRSSIAPGTPAGIQGYVYGLNATTNSGTPNTNIDVSSGVSARFDSPYTLITLASALTKNTANAWAVGTGNGSLDTGSIANSTYYGYLIQRSDTGVVDVLTSLSPTSPTMPTNYDRRSPALFVFTRLSGVNSVIAPLTAGKEVIFNPIEISSAVASIDIPNLGAYRQVEIEGWVVAVSASPLLATVSTDNGATFITTATYSYQSIVGTVGSVSSAGPTGQGAMQLTAANNITTTTVTPATFKIEFDTFNEAREMKARSTFEITSTPVAGFLGHRNTGTTARNAVRIILGTGNIAAASLRVKGRV